MAPWGRETALIVQVWPFHTSAKIPFPPRPAAMQAFAALHDRPDRSPPVAPLGLGVALIVQVWPFHTSANVRPWLFGLL